MLNCTTHAISVAPICSSAQQKEDSLIARPSRLQAAEDAIVAWQTLSASTTATTTPPLAFIYPISGLRSAKKICPAILDRECRKGFRRLGLGVLCSSCYCRFFQAVDLRYKQRSTSYDLTGGSSRAQRERARIEPCTAVCHQQHVKIPVTR